MPPRTIAAEGRQWRVAPSGRRTQYTRDEFGVVFTSNDADRLQRVARYSPQGVRSPELAFAALEEADLRTLFARSQPSWTSPELGYRR